LRPSLLILLAGVLLLSACADATESSAPGATAAPASTTGPVDPASAPADPSPGCGTAVDVAPGESEQHLASEDTERTYLQYVPSDHDGVTPLPLVLDFHGLLEGSGIHAVHTELGPFGETQGFVTVTPDSGREPDRWDLGGDEDVTFVADLLDQVEGDLCIDRRRVHATGLSMGGFMTSLIGCRLSDRIASAAPVGGIGVIEPCDRSRPVPAIIFHGTDDPVLAYDGGLGGGSSGLPTFDGSDGTLGDLDDDELALVDDLLPGAEASAAAWAAGNGCPDAEPVTTAISETVDRLDYGCEVELYRVNGGGHTWPGSTFDTAIEDIAGAVDLTLPANEVLWAFFQDHPLTG
jgi:polyhydroxybutyrate depolymerase